MAIKGAQGGSRASRALAVPKRAAAAPKSKKPAEEMPQAPIRRPVIPSPPELKPVMVHGLYVDSVSVIPKTAASLHLLPAWLDDDDAEEKPKVLVPFAEMRLGGGSIQASVTDGEDIDPPTLFTASIPLENLAYILLDLTSDMKRICNEICSMSGDLAVDPARMAHVRYFAAHLERQARLCRFRIDSRYGAPEEPTK
jgi:hypothetical protein